MGVFDKFKDLVGIEEIDEDDITEEEIAEAESRIERQPIDAKPRYQRTNRENVVPLNSRATSALKLVVIEPTGFDESPRLVDSLKDRKPVIINLERIDSETARKIFDFLSGATYALNGNVQKIANNIFVFAPENVDITANDSGSEFDFSGINKDTWR
ncbi:MAG: cell division protein SepF [Anaerovoracaceae bacterium]